MAISDWTRASASVRKVSDKVRESLRGLQPWHRSVWSAHSSLSYQTCRFCKRGQGEIAGLWKYAVRHYACDDCRDGIIGKAAR